MTLYLLYLFAAFLCFASVLIIAWADVAAFEKAIDSRGMTAIEWESNKYRFWPGGGFAAWYKYCIKH